MLRRIELIGGVATGLLGLLGIAYALLGPTGQYAGTTVTSSGSVTTTQGTTSLLQQGLHPVTILFITIMALCMVGVAAGAYLHSQRGRRLGLVLLWVATPLLAAGTLISGFSIGIYLLPAALLAVVTLLAGSWAQTRGTRPS